MKSANHLPHKYLMVSNSKVIVWTLELLNSDSVNIGLAGYVRCWQ